MGDDANRGRLTLDGVDSLPFPLDGLDEVMESPSTNPTHCGKGRVTINSPATLTSISAGGAEMTHAGRATTARGGTGSVATTRADDDPAYRDCPEVTTIMDATAKEFKTAGDCHTPQRGVRNHS